VVNGENGLIESQIHSIVGDDGFTRLVAAFYRRVPMDDILSAMYPADDLEGAQWRLQEFLIQRFGGPARYSDARGHPRLRMRHVPFPIDLAARNRWRKLMDEALDETALDPQVDAVLRAFFDHVATFLMNR
jgi:hemoglobin